LGWGGILGVGMSFGALLRGEGAQGDFKIFITIVLFDAAYLTG